MIVPPRRAEGDPERTRECQQALQAEFRALAQRAHGAGWSETEIEQALFRLAVEHIREHQNAEPASEQRKH
ncbi:hypothetical protein NA8A_04055 [Nitratireductor indicus C115]|uniref:Uncharacterized protein n=1 Tax=Nitratireductor indicus C115 TaxID=1231190 RepID=K2N8X7_9HYPH|nr:hypothetical protein NA8A_04055 [Nitratireductor indicus C115]SFQ13457.1 hypothetical protein SAMN05216176_101504 [Nitratireductor indicus]